VALVCESAVRGFDQSAGEGEAQTKPFPRLALGSPLLISASKAPFGSAGRFAESDALVWVGLSAGWSRSRQGRPWWGISAATRLGGGRGRSAMDEAAFPLSRPPQVRDFVVLLADGRHCRPVEMTTTGDPAPERCGQKWNLATPKLTIHRPMPTAHHEVARANGLPFPPGERR